MIVKKLKLNVFLILSIFSLLSAWELRAEEKKPVPKKDEKPAGEVAADASSVKEEKKVKPKAVSSESAAVKKSKKSGKKRKKKSSVKPPVETPKVEEPSDEIPEGVELVNISFPEPTDIKDVIKAVSLWKNKTMILDDRTISGKVQILSTKETTKEEAYQIFLEALNTVGLTTVETAEIVKIVKHTNAKRDNLPTYHGNNWAPKTGEFITQVIPLKYVQAKDVSLTLSRMFPTNSILAYEATNTLIVSDTGNQIQRILDILSLLDVQKQQPKVMIVPIKYSDPKTVASKVQQILKTQGGVKSSTNYNSFKILTDERTSSVIIFGPPRTLSDIKNLVTTFDIKASDPAMESTIHVRPLDYADAKGLASTLSSLTQSSSSKKGSRNFTADVYTGSSSKSGSSTASVAALSDGVKISADQATNSLIITGSRAAYNALNVIIRKLDKQRSQVYLEVDIMEITNNDNLNLGMSLLGAAGLEGDSSWGSLFGFEASGGASALVAAQALATQNGGADKALKAISQAFSQNLQVGILGPAVSIPGLGDGIRPGLMIDMLKADSNSRVIQTPQILTQNNQDATVVVGEKRIYYEESSNVTTGQKNLKAKSESVDLTLIIKPNISSYSNYVTLKIDLDANSISGFGRNGAPQVAKRKTKQLVTVKNNQTVVISGLISQEERETYSKVPFFGDIPLLGMFFRKNKVEKTQKNLVMFVTPHVIHGPGDLAAIYKAKLDERDAFLKSIYGKGVTDSEFYRLLPNYKHGAYKPTKHDAIEDRRREEERKETLKIMGYTEDPHSTGKSPFKAPVERTLPVASGASGSEEASKKEDKK